MGSRLLRDPVTGRVKRGGAGRILRAVAGGNGAECPCCGGNEYNPDLACCGLNVSGFGGAITCVAGATGFTPHVHIVGSITGSGTYTEEWTQLKACADPLPDNVNNTDSATFAWDNWYLMGAFLGFPCQWDNSATAQQSTGFGTIGRVLLTTSGARTTWQRRTTGGFALYPWQVRATCSTLGGNATVQLFRGSADGQLTYSATGNSSTTVPVAVTRPEGTCGSVVSFSASASDMYTEDVLYNCNFSSVRDVFRQRRTWSASWSFSLTYTLWPVFSCATASLVLPNPRPETYPGGGS